MTRDEIMKLEGRELDTAVAEYVMGWIRNLPNDGWWTGDAKVITYFSPSKSILSAWHVVEKMKENSYSLFLSVYHDKKPKGFFTKGLGYKNHEVIADTELLAICRAALLAVLT